NDLGNQTKITESFHNAANWAALSDQLTKKLRAERFKNVKLTFKNATFVGTNIKTPTVTFTVPAKEGYTLVDSGENASATEISLVVRIWCDRGTETTIRRPTQGP
ncbi:hemagglutinin, partial [Mycoplasmopsis synoviae]